MTVAELMYELEQYDENLEIRLMEQPSWPFEYAINGLVDRATVQRCDGEDGEPDRDPAADKKSDNVVFILEGNQLCYGDKNAWN